MLDLYECLWGPSAEEEIVLSVLGSERRVWNDGSVKFDEIEIRFAKFHIRVSVNIDTDELIIEAHAGEQSGASDLLDINNDLPISGKRFGWYWHGQNTQGYSDVFLFAVAEQGIYNGSVLQPRYGFLGEASAISLLYLSEKPV